MVKPGKEEIACMLRSYHLTHLSDAGKAEKILHEMDGLEGMHSARISADLKELDVDAEEGKFSFIMDHTVNICRKIAESHGGNISALLPDERHICIRVLLLSVQTEAPTEEF